MNPLIRAISKLIPKLQEKHTFGDVLSMYDKGAFTDAYNILCEFLKKHPKLSEDGSICVLLAELELLANDNTSRAMALLDKVHRGDSLDTIYYYSVRGDALYSTGKYEEAIQSYEQAVAIDANIENLTMLARVLSVTDDSRAMCIWKRIIDEDKSNCLAYAYMGLELVKSGDQGKAMLMAKRAEKLNPSSKEFFIIGCLYFQLGEFHNAIGSFLEANKLGYKSMGLLYAYVAACYLSLNQAVPARKFIQWAVECDSEHEYVKEIWNEYKERYGEP